MLSVQRKNRSKKDPQKSPFFAPGKNQGEQQFIRPEMTPGSVTGDFGKEADTTIANKLRPMPRSGSYRPFFAAAPLIQKKCSECEVEEELQRKTSEEGNDLLQNVLSSNPIQRQEKEEEEEEQINPDFVPPLVGPSAVDWFEMSRPFYNRGAGHLLFDDSAFNSIGSTWIYNFNFFNNLLRFGPEASTSAANFFTPFAIDSGLSTDYPTWWDLSDQEMDTSSLVINPTLFNFDISTGAFTMPWPFRDVFGLPENPYPLQRKHASNKNEDIQRKGSSPQPKTSDIIEKTLRSTGKPLENNTCEFMGNRFGYDFSDVKIHTGPLAAKSAQSINALAYTSGNSIVFNEDQYVPEKESGKRLLAHELTHVVQQNNGQISRKLIQKQPLDWEDPIHGSLLDQFTAETGIPREQASQHSPEYRQWLSSKNQTSTVNINSSCNKTDIIDLVNQSLSWLDDIYQQLLEYDADEVFKDAIPPRSNHARIAGALQQAFNTTDLSYVEVIRRRFLHLAQSLRTNGKITIECNGQHCTAGGASFTAAYVAGPYALTMCSVGTTGNRPIATFIHELTHAIIPQIGISNDVSTVGRVRDRAYRGDRVFQHLSPEETLDNADSYGILAELLHARANTQLVAPQADTTQNCSQPNIVLEAFARADQWNSFALHELDLDVTLLQGSALNTLVAGNLAMLNRAFPNITTTAQLTSLRDAFQRLKGSGFDGSNWSFKCVTNSDANCGSNVVYSDGGKVTDSSVTLKNMQVNETARICPDWFSLSADDRTRTIYAAFIIGRPGWIVAGLQLQNALDHVDGAKSLMNETIPTPTTRSAREHIESDEQLRRSKNSTKP